MRAVELYIKLGKRIQATIRQLGYPTKNSLAGWHREYEQHHDLVRVPAPRKHKYSQVQKEMAVRHYLDHGHCIVHTVKVLGYPCRDLLATWIGEMHPELRVQVVGRPDQSAPRPQALKHEAVIALCTREGSAEALAQEFGVCRPTLYNWKNQLLGADIPASMKRHRDLPAAPERQELERQIEELRRDIRRLQLEQDLLKKANELIKKEEGISPQHLTNREKTLLVDALRQTYTLAELLREVGLPRSSYFYHRARFDIADRYVEVRRTITEIFERNHRCYGYRRMQASLNKQSVNISEKVVQRLMKQECLVVAKPKRRRYGSYLGKISPAPENLINRDFQAAAPNMKWLTDITEFHIPAGKVYLSPMIDYFDGMVISWSIGTRPDAELANSMLDTAIESVASRSERPVLHSDRGAHYRWPGWLSRIANAGLTRSMSRKACCADNAACEGFFGRLKTELFYPHNWQSVSIEQFIQTLDSYIRWYNDKRIKMSLGSLSPVEYRRSLGLIA
ncbi:IS3 family transposase [Paucibacter sp. TC2R-5]|uniref:IS3 family transposase n=1 Tax=Paucibacter sp. TC2R-5 TaxID=2893555 RepID=UPI0021E42904|nr:IS3 family transposase [Paucibacter sp. TC2R-5]MCV2357435.1 IS3 family transposase [Paucibacter sp. TC2R-5]